jgi:hypothetical protein
MTYIDSVLGRDGTLHNNTSVQQTSFAEFNKSTDVSLAGDYTEVQLTVCSLLFGFVPEFAPLSSDDD